MFIRVHLRLTQVLELVLQRKLHLPRRTGVARPEARIRNLPEVCSSHHASRLTKVRMVEYIEHFPAKLDQLRFRQVRALNHREVGVVESRSNHHVAAEITELIRWHHKRS